MVLTFNKKIINDYWKIEDQEFLKVIKKIETLEYWTLQADPHTIIYLSFLKEHLIGCNDNHFISESQEFLDLYAYLPFSYFVEFIVYLKQQKPLILSHYIQVSLIFLKANIASGILFYKRLHILRIYGKLDSILAKEHKEKICYYLDMFCSIN